MLTQSQLVIVQLCGDDKVLSEHGLHWLFGSSRDWKFIHSVDFGSNANFSLFCYNLGEDRETKCQGKERLLFPDG
jgi:hypothetical protein